MKNVQSFNSLIENASITNWDKHALTDYEGDTLQYHDVARKIENKYTMFEHSELKHGDKIALYGHNSAMWTYAYLATVTYGVVIVPIRHDSTHEQVYNIVNHSDSKLLLVGDVASTTLDLAMMPNSAGECFLTDTSWTLSRSKDLTEIREHQNDLYGHAQSKDIYTKTEYSYLATFHDVSMLL
ncbi:MAG: AMP-binding protein [Prevotella sp.]|jgi:long-chain acyl-CoA synthetase